MPVIRQSQALYPFWGTAIRIINGLDPLGMQTTSEATYSMLLPGVSNLTNRVRYYGFYCWLLNFYFERESTGNSVEQFRFIRRAELMIALIMQHEHPEVTQITGSRYAANWLKEIWNSFDLVEGADYVKGVEKTLYWKHKSGAFGQYYLGAMKVLNLVQVGTDNTYDELYNITNSDPQRLVSGQSLAEAFDATLTVEAKNLFYQNIRHGQLARSDIPFLAQYFIISQINPFEKEGELYIQMLREQDNPAQDNEDTNTFHRRETLIGLLNNAARDNNYNTQTYLIRCYEQQFGSTAEPATDTEIGWYTYLLNEYWQYACGGLLWAIVAQLKALEEPQFLPDFVRQIVKNVVEVMDRDICTTNSLGEALTQFPPSWTEEVDVRNIEESIYYMDDLQTAVNSFYLLFRLFANNVDYLQQVSTYVDQHRTRRDGNVVEGLQFILNARDQEFSAFIEQFLYRYIINRHRMVAMRKMGNGFQATHKFIIEENYIRPVENFTPRFTSPRMGAITNLLFDLQLIKKGEDGLLLSGFEELLGSQ